MAEELWEQVIYGDHCVHGTPIGTPGGADLMCMWCEDGYTHWLDDTWTQYTWYLRAFNSATGEWFDEGEEWDYGAILKRTDSPPDHFYLEAFDNANVAAKSDWIILIGFTSERKGEWVRHDDPRTHHPSHQTVCREVCG